MHGIQATKWRINIILIGWILIVILTLSLIGVEKASRDSFQTELLSWFQNIVTLTLLNLSFMLLLIYILTWSRIKTTILDIIEILLGWLLSVLIYDSWWSFITKDSCSTWSLRSWVLRIKIIFIQVLALMLIKVSLCCVIL
jgi:hypothetical protein